MRIVLWVREGFILQRENLEDVSISQVENSDKNILHDKIKPFIKGHSKTLVIITLAFTLVVVVFGIKYFNEAKSKTPIAEKNPLDKYRISSNDPIEHIKSLNPNFKLDKLTLYQFGQIIKDNYPEYNDMSNVELANKVLAKYPKYKDMIHETLQDSTSCGLPILKLKDNKKLDFSKANNNDVIPAKESSITYVIIRNDCDRYEMSYDYNSYKETKTYVYVSNVLEFSNFNYEIEYKIKEYCNQFTRLSCNKKDPTVLTFHSFKEAADFRDLLRLLPHEDVEIHENEIRL